MINRRKFMTLIKDYNTILDVYGRRLPSIYSHIFKVLNSSNSPMPVNVKTFLLENVDGLDTIYNDTADIIRAGTSVHSDYGDINRLTSNSFSKTLNSDEWKETLVKSMNRYAAPMGNLSNTCIFRHAMVKDRRISVINRKLDENLRSHIKGDMINFADEVYKIYHNFYIKDDLPCSIGNNITGFIRGKSYVEHAREHLGCKSAISIDISKFYDSISLATIIKNNLYYESLIASFKIKTGLEFSPESFTNPEHFYIFRDLLGMINISFIILMNYYTHNGLLPTGANYSPVVSNMIFAPMDLAIKQCLDDGIKYTRYADDICISSEKGYNDDGSFVLSMDYVLKMEKIINDAGFFLNYDKTHIMGPRDKKKVAGIILDTSGKTPLLSIGSAKKLELKLKYEGRKLHELDSSERGVLEWVKSINQKQYNFIRSGMSKCILAHDVTRMPFPPYARARTIRLNAKAAKLNPVIDIFKQIPRPVRGLTYGLYPEYQNATNGRAQTVVDATGFLAGLGDAHDDFAGEIPF